MSKIKLNIPSVYYKCENCKVNIKIDKSIIHQIDYMPIDNQILKMSIIYYDCPECRKRHYIQIDDITTKLMLSDIIEMMCKFAKKRKRNKQILESEQKRFKEAKQSLEDYRFELMKLYNNHEFINSETNEIENVRFSIDYGKRSEY